jgi:hypothetical protein
VKFNPSPELLVFRDGTSMVKVDDETGCWIWQGTKWKGYGRIRDGKTPSKQAHQYVYEKLNGATPDGFVLGHVCYRRSCCSPRHVRPITEACNNAERYQKPWLSRAVLAEIEELLGGRHTDGHIANHIGVSIWSIRQIRREVIWRDQFNLFI